MKTFAAVLLITLAVVKGDPSKGVPFEIVLKDLYLGFNPDATGKPADLCVVQPYEGNWTHFALLDYTKCDIDIQTLTPNVQAARDRTFEYPPDGKELLLVRQDVSGAFASSFVNSACGGKQRQKRQLSFSEMEELDPVTILLGREAAPYANGHLVPYVKLILRDNNTDSDVEIKVTGLSTYPVTIDDDQLRSDDIEEYYFTPEEDPVRRRKRQDAEEPFVETFGVMDPYHLNFNGLDYAVEPGHRFGLEGFIMYPVPESGLLADIGFMYAIHGVTGYGIAISSFEYGDTEPNPFSFLGNVGMCNGAVQTGNVDQCGINMDPSIDLSTGWEEPPDAECPEPTDPPVEGETPAPTTAPTDPGDMCPGQSSDFETGIDPLNFRFYKKTCRNDTAKVNKACGHLNNSGGVFRVCHHISETVGNDSAINPTRAWEECVRAVCSNNLRQAVCDVYERFAEACQAEFKRVYEDGSVDFSEVNHREDRLDLHWRHLTQFCHHEKAKGNGIVDCVSPYQQRVCSRPAAGCSGFSDTDRHNRCEELVVCNNDLLWNGKNCVEKC